MFDRLSEDQHQVLNTVREGHNVFITGQGGTGKSFLVKEIYKELTRSGKRVAIICSTLFLARLVSISRCYFNSFITVICIS